MGSAHRAPARAIDTETGHLRRAGIAEFLEVGAAAPADRVVLHRADALVARALAVSTIAPVVAVTIPAVPVVAIAVPVPVRALAAVIAPAVAVLVLPADPVAIRAAELAFAAADDAVAAGARLAGIGEGLAVAAALAADRGIFTGAELRRARIVAASALVGLDRAGRQGAGREKDGDRPCEPGQKWHRDHGFPLSNLGGT
nr:conserved hypothetical protein [Rhizobiaceae bacterium]